MGVPLYTTDVLSCDGVSGERGRRVSTRDGSPMYDGVGSYPTTGHRMQYQAHITTCLLDGTKEASCTHMTAPRSAICKDGGACAHWIKK